MALVPLKLLARSGRTEQKKGTKSIWRVNGMSGEGLNSKQKKCADKTMGKIFIHKREGESVGFRKVLEVKLIKFVMRMIMIYIFHDAGGRKTL
jgi:hypothetical protein